MIGLLTTGSFGVKGCQRGKIKLLISW